MNIYIYGSSSFKKQMHSALDHANVKFRLDSHGIIEDITSLEVLKMTIQENPDDIYLIDQEKIIDSGSLKAKIGFLKPKDAIEKSFLEDNGIGDIVVDNINEIGRHIVKKLDKLHLNDYIEDVHEKPKIDKVSKQDFDSPLSKMGDINALKHHLEEIESIDDEPINMSDNDDDLMSFNFDDLDNEKNKSTNDMDSDLEFDLDEDLNGLLVFEEVEDNQNETNKASNYDDDILNFDFDDVDLDLQKNKVEEPKMIFNDDMFSVLDSISEEQMMMALESVPMPVVAKPVVNTSKSPYDDIVKEQPKQNNVSTVSASAASFSGNFGDIGALISELLKNKTIEISIKIKE